MKVLLLGGTGVFGKSAAALLAREDLITEIGLTSRSLGNAQRAATEIGDKTHAVCVDIKDLPRLAMIAAGQGKLELDQPIVSFFPNRTIANLDERKEKITVRHLTGMVNGLESGCLAGDGPTIAAMMAQPDWVQAALDRKMAQEPGTSSGLHHPIRWPAGIDLGGRSGWGLSPSGGWLGAARRLDRPANFRLRGGRCRNPDFHGYF